MFKSAFYVQTQQTDAKDILILIQTIQCAESVQTYIFFKKKFGVHLILLLNKKVTTVTYSLCIRLQLDCSLVGQIL